MCMSWGMGIKTAPKDRVWSNNGRRREREDRRDRERDREREREREQERERKQVQERVCPPKMRANSYEVGESVGCCPDSWSLRGSAADGTPRSASRMRGVRVLVILYPCPYRARGSGSRCLHTEGLIFNRQFRNEAPSIAALGQSSTTGGTREVFQGLGE
jgi:hypothetical protein